MRQFVIILLLILINLSSKGQDGYTHFTLRGGYLHDKAFTFSLGLDFAKKYHSAWELTGTYIKSFSNEISYETIFNEVDSTFSQRTLNHSYKNLLMGVQYKPLITRSKNTLLRFRFGAYIGSDFNRFIASPNVGFELLQSLTPSTDIFFSNSNGYYLWASPKATRWRHTAEIGFRLAL